MKKVFLIGKFNEFFREMNEFLSGHFNVQVCVDNANLIKEMIVLFKPDIIVISLVEMEQQKISLFNRLKETYSHIPMLCVGTEDGMKRFSMVLDKGTFKTLSTPISNDSLLEQMYELLHIDYDVESKIEKTTDSDRKCILLVDDSPMQLRVLNELLKKNYDVMMATSGPKALTLLGQRLPDLIFLDYDMPECDGRMTLQMIREIEEAKEIPVVFLTGINDGKHIRAVLDLHPDGYLLKPANSKMLNEALNKYLK